MVACCGIKLDTSTLGPASFPRGDENRSPLAGQDYNARTHYLVANYRSTANIINTANQLIELNGDRMKTGHPIRINAARRSEPAGEPVRIVACPDPLQQARFVLDAIKKYRSAGGNIAFFSRTKSELHAIRAALETTTIPSFMASQGGGNTPLHRMREINALIEFIRQLQQSTVPQPVCKTSSGALPVTQRQIPGAR